MAAPVNRIRRFRTCARAPKVLADNHFAVVSPGVIAALGGMNLGQRMMLEQAFRQAQEAATRPNRWRIEQWCGLN